MRDRSQTIAALRRLAERPGTPAEGETARRMLELMGGGSWIPKPFDALVFPVGTVVFYCYWCYRNDRGVICKQPPKMEHGKWWMRIKFDHLKQARWVPVTSHLGCHLGATPFTGNDRETLCRGDEDWQMKDREWRDKLKSLGIKFKDTETTERVRRCDDDSLRLDGDHSRTQLDVCA